jgi:hypothetical protein
MTGTGHQRGAEANSASTRSPQKNGERVEAVLAPSQKRPRVRGSHEFHRRDLLRAALFAGAALPLSSNMAHAAQALSFDGLYKSRGVRGLEFSDALLALRGQRVAITGFMAPPLKADSTFFVLTAQPMAICPFCASDADWPDDIIVVMLKTVSPMLGGGSRLAVTGTLEVGSRTDAATGFVSQIRLVDASFAPA